MCSQAAINSNKGFILFVTCNKIEQLQSEIDLNRIMASSYHELNFLSTHDITIKIKSRGKILVEHFLINSHHDITYDILGICCFDKRSISPCFLLNPTCVTLTARPRNSYEITEPNQMTSDPESRCIEYSFFNDHLHLKWFLLKIFCWLFKDPNTSQPIRKSWYCLLSLFMVHGSLTVAGSLLLYLTSHRRLNRYLDQYPLLPELSFFLGLSLSR